MVAPSDRGIRADSLVLHPNDTLQGVARSIIDFHLRALERERARALEDEAESVHQARVAVRRLRASVRLFSALLQESDYRAFSEELAWLGGAIGCVRDLDVVALKISGSMQSLCAHDRNAIGGIQADLLEERARAFSRLAAILDSVRYRELVDNLARGFAAAGGVEVTLAQSAPDLLRRLVWGLSRTGRKARRDRSDKRLHRLRVRAKRLRYALEAFSGLGGKSLREALAELTALQELLGANQDTAMTVEWLRAKAYSGTVPTAALLSIGALIHIAGRRSRKLKKHFMKLWRRLESKISKPEALIGSDEIPPISPPRLKLVSASRR